MLRLSVIASLLLAAAGAFAEVREQAVKLPDDLGSAIIYNASTPHDNGTAVIVIHEWWGLNDYARDRARMLAEAGYTTIAVDMYGHGKVAGHPDNAKAFMNAALAEPEKMNARFSAARELLAAQKGVDASRIFAMGYCFGGAVVLNQARQGAELAGVASFHGSLGTETPAEKGAIKARILVAHGGADPFVPVEQVSGFVTEMVNAGADFELLNYPQAQHSFTNPGATDKGKAFNLPLAYDADADAASWAALLDFLSR